MSFAEKIIELVQKKPGMTDREITDFLKNRNAPQQHINQQARRLEDKGFLVRQRRDDGKIGNFPSAKMISKPHVSSSSNVQKDWFWEGNVQDAIAHHLERQGWHLVNISNTASKERGVDIHAEKSGKVLLLEIKGYPSTKYSDPKRAHEKKPTSPILQAGHWYSHAVLKAMRLQSEQPKAQIVIGLPDFKRYRNLFEETQTSLQKLGFQVWGVDKEGVVTVW